MRRSFLLLSAAMLASLGVTWAGQGAQENSDKSKSTGDYKIAPEDAARQFKPGHGRQVDIDDANMGIFGGENPFAAFGVGRFQDHHLRVVREQCATAGSDNRMIINDQNAH